jgi:phage gpG-like protein
LDSGLDENIRGAERWIFDQIESVLKRIGMEIERDIVDYIERYQIQVQGDLKKSITSEVKKELARVVLQVGSNIEYGVYVHEGTKPHWPPEAPIKRWVIKKFGYSGDEVKKVTGAVRFAISQKGTKGKPFIGFVLRQYEKTIVKLIADRLRERFNVL